MSTISYIEPNNLATLKEQAFESFVKNRFDEATSLYEQLISLDSSNKTNYWYLGLSQLLQGQEEDAQMTWLLAIENAELDQIEMCTNELEQILEKEAQRKESLESNQDALTIRSHLCDVNPYNLTNLISIVLLSAKLKTFASTDIVDLGIIDLLSSEEIIPLSEVILLEILEKILAFIPLDETVTQFIESICLFHAQYRSAIINTLYAFSTKIANENSSNTSRAIKILEICLHLDSQNLEILMYLLDLHLHIKNYEKSIEVGEILYSVASKGKTIDKVFACQWLVKALIANCTYWEEAAKVHQECENHLKI